MARTLYLICYVYYELYYAYGIYSDPRKLLDAYEYIISWEPKERIENIDIYVFEENKLEGEFLKYFKEWEYEFETSYKTITVDEIKMMLVD